MGDESKNNDERWRNLVTYKVYLTDEERDQFFSPRMCILLLSLVVLIGGAVWYFNG
jgi:hypothetical protein